MRMKCSRHVLNNYIVIANELSANGHGPRRDGRLLSEDEIDILLQRRIQCNAA